MNNETFRDKQVPAAPDGVLTRAGRRPPTAQQRESLVFALLTDPHFGRACTAAGISRAAGYRLVNSDPEVAEAMQLAKDLYLRDLLDAVREEAVEGRAPDEQPKRIRDNRLLAAALRTLLGTSAVTINNTNAQQNVAAASEGLTEAQRRRLDELLGAPLLPADTIEGTFVPVEPGAAPAPSSATPDDSIEDLL